MTTSFWLKQLGVVVTFNKREDQKRKQFCGEKVENTRLIVAKLSF